MVNRYLFWFVHENLPFRLPVNFHFTNDSKVQLKYTLILGTSIGCDDVYTVNKMVGRFKKKGKIQQKM